MREEGKEKKGQQMPKVVVGKYLDQHKSVNPKGKLGANN